MRQAKEGEKIPQTYHRKDCTGPHLDIKELGGQEGKSGYMPYFSRCTEMLKFSGQLSILPTVLRKECPHTKAQICFWLTD